MSNGCLTQKGLVKIDGGFQAVLSETHDLSYFFEDERLAGFIALHLESSRVVPSVLHALESIENGLENEPTVLGQYSSISQSDGRRDGLQDVHARRGMKHRQRFRTWLRNVPRNLMGEGPVHDMGQTRGQPEFHPVVILWYTALGCRRVLDKTRAETRIDCDQTPLVVWPPYDFPNARLSFNLALPHVSTICQCGGSNHSHASD